MREIKFRAWDSEQKEMYLFFDIKDFTLGSLNRTDTGYKFMQYTGLKDKNGKEIHDGDIIKYDEDESMNHWVSGAVAQIISLPGRFTARLTPYDKFNGSNQNTLNEDFEDSVTIIGNIYENPELLN